MIGRTIYVLVVSTAVASADVLTFENDYAGFVEAAGPLSVIDFETDPNGEPTDGGDELTETFNYDSQGIHFSAGYPNPPFPYPILSGGDPYELTVLAPPFEHTWIIGEFTTPALAIGGFFPGITAICAFDEDSVELGCAAYNKGGSGNFVGIVSDVPIYGFTFDDGDNGETIESVGVPSLPRRDPRGSAMW